MSVAGSCRRSLHQRKDSDEIDVFEAARYFSDYNYDTVSAVPTHDRHSNNNNYVTQKSNGLEKHQQMKEILKKSRGHHPSSPGGRIASFLNSLFSQTASKKKKSTSSSAAKSIKDDYDGDTWKRRRRSSISHIQSSSSRTTTTATTTTTSARSLYSSSSSGFRTPPPYMATPAASKSLKELKNYLDQKQAKSAVVVLHNDAGKKRSMDKKFKGLKNNNGGLTTELVEDDGAESDSSSDLFELTNYDMGFVASELPVYETTHIHSIKRGTTISNIA